MKITVEIPDWAVERHLWFMAGIEVFAFRLAGEDKIYVKTNRCNLCGKCCMNLPKGPEPLNEKGNCIHLEDAGGGQWECGLQIYRPWVCSTSMHTKQRYAGCSIEYQEVPIGDLLPNR